MTILLRQKPLTQVVRQIVQRDNGVWLDPEDMSTMYQDAAGTTPVTALEQPVGLWLDKSQGLELGPELITNGDNEAGVTTAPLDVLTNFTSKIQSSEKAQSGNYSAKLTSNTTSGPHYWRLFNIPAGVSLRVTGWVYMPTASTNNQPIKLVDFSDGSFIQVIASSFDNWVYFSVIRTAKSTPWILSLGNNESSNWNGGSIYIDNLSIREIKGNHATQSITASRPTLSARYNLLLNSSTLSTQSVTTVAEQYTLSFTGTGSVTLSGTATGTLAGTGANNRVNLSFTPTAGTLTLTVTGSVTLAMLAFGTLTTYQEITTATSYDSAGWNRYIRFDGIDDYLNLPYMGLYAKASASVVTSVSMNNSASQYVLLSESNGAAGVSLYYLGRQAANSSQFDMLVRNDANVVNLDSNGATGLSNSRPRIISLVDTGVVASGFNNSSSTLNTAYTRVPPVTLSTTVIGATLSSSAFNFIDANSYGIIITKSALSDTDRRRCEQFLASRLSTLGVTLS